VVARPADIYASQNEAGLLASVRPGDGGRLGFLDALRGLAILGVIGLHASLAVGRFPGSGLFKLGEYGVQLFFIISGFTITLAFKGRLKAVSRPNLDFFIRRFLRLAPMFWTGILIYSFLPGREPTNPAISVGWPHYLATLFFVHGWHRETLNSVVPGGWSIAVEATFYLCVPFIAGRIGRPSSAAWFFLASVVAGQAANILARMFLGWHTDPNYSLDSLFLARWFPGQLCFFATGVLLYELCLGESPLRPTRASGCFALALGTLMFLVLLHLGSLFLFLASRLCASISLALIFLGVAWSQPVMVVNAFTRLLGRLSFSCYILHFAVLHYVASWIQGGTPHGSLGFAAVFLATLALTMILAAVTFVALEKPGMRLAHLLTSRMEGSRT
jgi:peptidoglycan/LPS O-acetylase OafA/YrhL